MIKLRVWSSMACGKPMWNPGVPQSRPRLQCHKINLPLQEQVASSFIWSTFHSTGIMDCWSISYPPSPWGQTFHYQGILKKKIPNFNCSVAMDTLLDEWKRLNNTVDFNHNLDDYLRNMDEVPTENENHHEPPSTLLGVHPTCPLKKAGIFHGARQPTTPSKRAPPPRFNKGLIAGLVKGNHWFIRP